MITIKTYSERGLVVKGITADQAKTILGGLGKAVTQYNPMMGGYVFSRKREGQIRALVAKMEEAIALKKETTFFHGDYSAPMKEQHPQTVASLERPVATVQVLGPDCENTRAIAAMLAEEAAHEQAMQEGKQLG